MSAFQTVLCVQQNIVVIKFPGKKQYLIEIVNWHLFYFHWRNNFLALQNFKAAVFTFFMILHIVQYIVFCW